MFDPKKPVITREGKPVRILCIDLKSPKVEEEIE